MPKNKERLFSDDEAMAYIAALENPGKVGWDPAKKVWRTPKGKGYDNNQIAYGLDTRLEHNPIVYNYLKDKGRLDDPWLTDQEAKALTLLTFNKKRDTLNKAINLTGGNLSQRGYNVLAGMLWHGHPMKAMLSPDSITGKAFRRAIKNGDTDFDDVFDTYYQYGSNKRLFAERIKADAKFRPQSDNTSPFSKQDWSKSEIRIPVKEFKAPKPIPTDYSPVRDVPKRYDALNGAGSPTYGGYNPRVPSPYEIDARNQRDVWDIFDKGAVALGSKSFLPKVQDLMHEGAKDYVKGILGNASAYDVLSPTLSPFRIPDKFYSKGKDVTRKSLPRFDEGTPTTVGAYNVYPSAVGATGLEITTPEVSVLGRDKRPLYQRYDALNSTYDPNAIRSITDWVPGIGDVSLGFDAVNAFKNQDYMQAGMLGALMFAPNALEPVAKPILRNLSKYAKPAGSAITNVVKKIPGMDAAMNAISKRWDPDLFDFFDNGVPDYYGQNFDKYPEAIQKSLENSVYPRMRKMRPWMTDKQFKSAFDYAADGKYTVYPARTFKKAYGEDSNWAGLYYPDTDHIAIQEGKTFDALGHESRHKIDEAIPRTELEDKYLSDAYDDDFLSLEAFKDSDMNAERPTVNYDARRELIGWDADKYMSVEEQNKIIDSASDAEIFAAVENSNGYGKAYIESKRLAKKLTPEFARKIKTAMKKVGVAAAPIIPAGAALYMGAKDFKQEDLNNTINNLKVLAEGVGYNSGKDLPKYGIGEDIVNATVDFGKGVMPIYGTYLDAKEFYNNPSPETLGYLALSALSDGLLLSGAGSFLGMGLKSLRGARAASKAAKALSVTPGKHLARYSAKTAEAARLKKKAVQDLTKGVGVDIMPQAIQTYNKYAE